MRCAACQAEGQWSTAPLCPACHAVSGSALPAVAARPCSPLWLWTSRDAAAALATGSLAVILKVYRKANGQTQGDLATALGYDTSYISMIENERRVPTDVGTLRRIAEHIGLAPHVLGVTDIQAEDFSSMIQFGRSTIRLAGLARQEGHSTEAINELWPLIQRLESRISQGRTDRDAMLLLGQAQAALGIALGDVLPEERLTSSARWTGRAVRIAQRLDDPVLHSQTLRAHGNELRKVDRIGASAARLLQAAHVAPPAELGAVLIPLARTLGTLGDHERFDQVMLRLWQLMDAIAATPLVNEFVVREVQLRGLLATGRVHQAAVLARQDPPTPAGVAPQWHAIERVSVAEVFAAQGDLEAMTATLRQAITTAEAFRLPHQLQRAIRLAEGSIPELAHDGCEALGRLQLVLPAA